MSRSRNRVALRCAFVAAAILALTVLLPAQAGTGERMFPQSKTLIETALKGMQRNMSGRLPALEGFALTAEHPFDRYQRGYYQADVQVASTLSGGAWVRVSVQVTAWYSDPGGSGSGYQLLKSNGRLEADLLDQLSDQLNSTSSPPEPIKPDVERHGTTQTGAPQMSSKEPLIPAPARNPDDSQMLSLRAPLPAKPPTATGTAQSAKKTVSPLQAEADGLEEVLKNQAHPKNLVAVKKAGTPVVATASLTAKTLFLASMHDEFEMLDFNQDWVHVRISGLSRGWIWRNSVEMPDGIADSVDRGSSSGAAVADLFHVVREEAAPFPGDWEPLRGKTVKILSIQKTDEQAKDRGPQDKLEFAKFLLDKNYSELGQKPQELAGIVLIFDSADGGMIAATAGTLQRWKAGTLSDSALWHNCFFDPPETFTAAPSAGTQ